MTRWVTWVVAEVLHWPETDSVGIRWNPLSRPIVRPVYRAPYAKSPLRMPRLKVDWLFVNDDEPAERAPNSRGYLEELKEKLAQAYALADEHARARERTNKARYDRKVRTSGLQIGGRVLLRNVAVLERRKLNVYVVLRQQAGETSLVYVVRHEDGKGVERTLHRNMMLPCDVLPLRVESTQPPQRKRERLRPREQPVAAPPPHVVQEDDESSSDDEYAAYPRVADRQLSPYPAEDEELSSDDEPLARLLCPSIPSVPPTEGQPDDDVVPLEESMASEPQDIQSTRPRRRTQQHQRLGYDEAGQPIWRQHVVANSPHPPKCRIYSYSFLLCDDCSIYLWPLVSNHKSYNRGVMRTFCRKM